MEALVVGVGFLKTGEGSLEALPCDGLAGAGAAHKHVAVAGDFAIEHLGEGVGFGCGEVC